MTKRRLLGILSSLFDPLGVFFSPLRLTLKALYSAVCLEIPGRTREAFDTPLTCILPDLARITTELCNSLTRLELLQPMRRNVIPRNAEVSFLVATKDGSSTGYSATLHLTSKDNHKEKFECRIARAISRVKIASAATTELMGYTLAMDLVTSYLEATYSFWSNCKDEYNLFLMGDSQSSLLALGSHPKNIIARSQEIES